MIREAIQAQRNFNIIHLESFFKVDIFVSKEREFDRLQMARRSAYVLSTEPEQSAYVASAEDTILAKLEWYRIGGEVSDRQWRDILGVMKVQGNIPRACSIGGTKTRRRVFSKGMKTAL